MQTIQMSKNRTGFIVAAVSVFFFAPAFAFAISAPAVGTGNYAVLKDSPSVKVLGGADTGGDVSARVWFEWGTSNTSFNNATPSHVITTLGNVSEYITNLNTDQTYFYRIVAVNSKTTSYGEVKALIIPSNITAVAPAPAPTPTPMPTPTPAPLPAPLPTSTYVPPVSNSALSVVTQQPNVVMVTRVDVYGVASPGGAYATDGWFEWGTSSALGNQTPRKQIGSVSSILFSEMILGLSPDTTYYVRAVIQNGKGTASGNIVSFTTQKTPATIGQPSTAAASGSVASASGTGTKNTTVKDTKTEEKKSSDDEVKKEDQLASSIFAGGSFFPDTFIEWLILILLILILMIIGNFFYGAYKKRKEEEQKENENK